MDVDNAEVFVLWSNIEAESEGLDIRRFYIDAFDGFCQ